MLTLAVHTIQMPSEFDFTLSRGTQTVAQNVWVRLTWTDDLGNCLLGYGEAVSCAYYGYTLDHILGFLEALKAHPLFGELEPSNIQGFEALAQGLPQCPPAQAAVEMALWDLVGKRAGMPLYQLMGANPQAVPLSSYTIGLASAEETRHKTELALQRGYSVLKVKLGGPQDVDILHLIREIVGPQVTLRVDANAAWTPKEALPMLDVLVKLGVELVEEPLKVGTPADHRVAFKAACPLPLYADETVHTLKDMAQVAHWAHGVNLKLTKTGGLLEAYRMISAARALGLKIMLGCFVESSLSITAFAHLAPWVDVLDLDGALLLAQDPAQGVAWQGSQIQLPVGAGLGVTLSQEWVEAFA